MTTTNSGPFGTSVRMSLGHVLNALCKYGVPLREVESFQVGNNLIKKGEIVIGRYGYFNGIDQPLFSFENQSHLTHLTVVDPESSAFKTVFRLNLSHHNSAGLLILGDQATPELHEFITTKLFTQEEDAPGYSLRRNSGAFFEGGKGDPHGQWIYIEFNKSEGAQAFVDYINKNYMVEKSTSPQRTYTISTFEHRIAPHAKYSKYFTRYVEKNNKVMADFDNITDAEELYKALHALNLPVFRNYLT